MFVNPADRDLPSRTVTQDSLLLKEVLQSIDAQSCPTTYNFHMHTNCSDGKLDPAELMLQAVELGLQGMAITDHHSVKGYRLACQWMEDWRWRNPSSWGQKYRKKSKKKGRKPGRSVNSRNGKQISQPFDQQTGRPIVQQLSQVDSQQSRHTRKALPKKAPLKKALPKLWAGIEITSRLADTDVHILGYAFEPDDEAMKPYVKGSAPKGGDRQAHRVIGAIQAAGGIAVLAHPVRYRTDEITLINAAANLGIDGVETYYAYNNPAVWRPSPGKTERVAALALAHNLLSSCGTDTHGKLITRRL